MAFIDERSYKVIIADANGDTIWSQHYDEYSEAYHVYALLEDGDTIKGNTIELIQFNYANGKYINQEVCEAVGCSL